MKSVKSLALVICASVVAVLPLNAATTGHFERTLQVNGTVELEVTSGSGNINVHQGGAGTVSVSAKIHGNNGTSWLFGSGNIEERIHKIAKTGSGNVTVDRISGETKVSSGSGDLKINSVKGILYADTGSGNIHAEDIAGDVFVNTGSGDVEVRQSAGGSVKAQTGSGNIRLHGVKGGLRADAGSGDIQAEGDPTSDWRLGAGSGNITLKVPTQASFNLDARTSSGTLKLNSHQVTTQGTLAKNHIQGKVGNGGVLLDIHTGSGDIELQ
jgi:DUF4097 and DUF4098 domain-containing protein YvlB